MMKLTAVVMLNGLSVGRVTCLIHMRMDKNGDAL